MVASIQGVSNWARENSPIVVATTQQMRFISSSLTFFGAATTITATSSTSVPQTMTQTVFFHDDPAARILLLQWDPDSATARTLNVRITGTGQFGQPITEDVPMAQASGTATTYFTRNAFKTVSSAIITASTASSGGDTISLGIAATAIAGLSAGTQINGASATHYKGFGLALPVKNTLTAASPTAANCEVTGVSFTDANVAVALNRGAGHLIDAAYGVMVPQETLVLSGAGIYGFNLHIQTNRGE